jgi:hypothetical protein
VRLHAFTTWTTETGEQELIAVGKCFHPRVDVRDQRGRTAPSMVAIQIGSAQGRVIRAAMPNRSKRTAAGPDWQMPASTCSRSRS